MTSEQHSRLQQARAQIDAVRREVSTNQTDPNAKNQQQFKDNQENLDAALKALDGVKAIGG